MRAFSLRFLSFFQDGKSYLEISFFTFLIEARLPLMYTSLCFPCNLRLFIRWAMNSQSSFVEFFLKPHLFNWRRYWALLFLVRQNRGIEGVMIPSLKVVVLFHPFHHLLYCFTFFQIPILDLVPVKFPFPVRNFSRRCHTVVQLFGGADCCRRKDCKTPLGYSRTRLNNILNQQLTPIGQVFSLRENHRLLWNGWFLQIKAKAASLTRDSAKNCAAGWVGERERREKREERLMRMWQNENGNTKYAGHFSLSRRKGWCRQGRDILCVINVIGSDQDFCAQGEAFPRLLLAGSRILAARVLVIKYA